MEALEVAACGAAHRIRGLGVGAQTDEAVHNLVPPLAIGLGEFFGDSRGFDSMSGFKTVYAV